MKQHAQRAVAQGQWLFRQTTGDEVLVGMKGSKMSNRQALPLDGSAKIAEK